MKRVFQILMGSMLFMACSKPSTPDHHADFRVNPIELDWADDAADIYVRFNIMDNSVDDKVLWGELNKEQIEVVSDNQPMTVKDVTKLTNLKGSIPDDILVMLLVDRNIRSDDMESVRQAVSNFVATMPENTVYISFFDEQLRISKRITSENFDDFQKEFTVSSNKNKYLFDVALKKFQELCGEKGLTTDQQLIARIENADVKKYLVLLTDGRIDANNILTVISTQKFSDYVQTWDKNTANNNRVEIHAIRYGDVTSDVDQTLSYLCVDLRNANVKGGLYIADPDAFTGKLMVTDKTYPDYELTIANPKGETGYGAAKDLQIRIKANGKTADVQTQYALGTLMKPVKSGYDNHWRQLWTGALIAITLLIITFLVLHIVIPFMRVYLSNFEKKYVRYYSFDKDCTLQCHYCKNEILDGDEIVVKCKHTVHKHCWVENGCKCADYGENCKDGKQFFFDTGKLLDKNNRLFYANFALWGMVGGLISWLMYHLITYWFPHPFEALTASLLTKFYPDTVLFMQLTLMLKTGGIMLAGLLSGCILTFVILYHNKYREKHFSVVRVILKSMLGALAGWAVFLLGAILVISCKADVNTPLVELLPWALAGCVWGWCLSLRTNAVMLHTMLGGLIAGLVGFFVLFLGKFLGVYAVVFSFMALGAALGVAFIYARRTVHKYYLKFNQGNQPVTVAIHKWMSVAGGGRDVTIGKSKDCTICMNWDTHNSIRDVNVSLYMDKKDKIPVLKVMDSNIIYNRTNAKTNEEFALKHGARFQIGNTEFRYIE